MLVLPQNMDPEGIDLDSVQNELEDKFCNDMCLHVYKIKENGQVIFDSRW